MFRTYDPRPTPFARIALPGAIALAALLAILAAAVLLVRGADALALAVLALAIAVALGIGAGWRAYADTRRRLEDLRVFAADVVESVAIGVVTLDLDGRVTAISGRAAELLGIDQRRTRVPYREVFAGAPILCDAAERLTGRRAAFRSLEVAGRGGRTLTIDGSFLETHAGERIGAVIQVADVTEQRVVEREVRRSEHLASLGTLAASVAHEIRNPLTALDINVQLLGESLAEARAAGDAGRYLRVIETELRRLDAIVENFIRFARPTPLERAPVALERLVEETLALVAPECRRHRVRLERRGLDGAGASVLATEGELQQALLNVILNAIQAMPEGGTLGVSLERGPAEARVTVRDTGPGIPAAAQDRIFELFFTTREGGTGLGLPIAKKILEAHGGGVAFETSNAGTAFTLSLPLHAPAPAVAVSERARC
jgi:signal transduction histidine kinase